MPSTVSPAPAQTQTFAFITHSPATLPNNLPPEVDDASLARRRRRRTSHKDQAILEAEFAVCDRPDRNKRKEIADLVGLKEKQVQIWFQNRRQTTRRKSKPLQPHEMIPRNSEKFLQLSSDPFISSPLNPKNAAQDDDTIELPSHSSRASSPCPVVDTIIKTESDMHKSDMTIHMSDGTEPDLTIDTSISSIESMNEPEIVRKTSPIHFLLNPSAETPNTSFDSQTTIADEPEMSQLNTTMMDMTESVVNTYVNPRRSGLTAQPQPSLLKRSSSAVRLSMSFDGKATVVLEDEEDDIPHGSQTSTLIESPQASFHESVSLVTPPKRRTVNAKIWESACDSQSSLPTEPVKEDSPRKALKAIRARGVVAAAKAAAESRKHKGTATQSSDIVKKKKKVLCPKSGNIMATPTAKGAKVGTINTTTPVKSSKVLRSSPTKDKTRKVVTATHKGPKKVTPSPPTSAVKAAKKPHNYSPLRTLQHTLSGKNDKPGFTIYQSSDEGDSDKENWEPGHKGGKKVRTSSQPIWRNKTGRNILGDLGEERVPQPNELEVIENLMSLRDGLWR
ncbi:hypothetical protein H072_1197 [Dactylellina haptotyla CBS 200.50]|uniref:Homeobox domain-containing protein n=1 Tax=Dactylellina haptotyla (strain CBS 200.50) TaxID=1284197 RepID=S8BZK3_DACHA|nr:hypothetical protein H072_1197 [Dactylellina haptotyla CBS 200.50]